MLSVYLIRYLALSYLCLQSGQNICRWPLSQVLGLGLGLGLGLEGPVLGLRSCVTYLLTYLVCFISRYDRTN